MLTIISTFAACTALMVVVKIALDCTFGDGSEE